MFSTAQATPAPKATFDNRPEPPSARIRWARRLPRYHRLMAPAARNSMLCVHKPGRFAVKSAAVTGDRSNAIATTVRTTRTNPLAAITGLR
ncbi:hypothetical protein Aph02nite_90620 [Actinoplanes philippinensis]|nr:hypothetical protein Aph02nite_90620 [Actinoplanes philippinensis]